MFAIRKQTDQALRPVGLSWYCGFFESPRRLTNVEEIPERGLAGRARGASIPMARRTALGAGLPTLKRRFDGLPGVERGVVIGINK